MITVQEVNVSQKSKCPASQEPKLFPVYNIITVQEVDVSQKSKSPASQEPKLYSGLKYNHSAKGGCKSKV